MWFDGVLEKDDALELDLKEFLEQTDVPVPSEERDANVFAHVRQRLTCEGPLSLRATAREEYYEQLEEQASLPDDRLLTKYKVKSAKRLKAAWAYFIAVYKKST